MILLIGGTGYVGRAFARRLQAMGTPFRIVSRRAGENYYDPQVLETLIADHGATFLINAAGYAGRPNVDACEIHRAECLNANAVLPGRIRRVCEATGTPWGHVSSGCVFQGRRTDGVGFVETDRPNFCFRTDNCSFYSGCKALGEEVLDGADGVYIWRLRMPFDHHDGPRNYLSKLMRYQRLLQAENSITHLGEFVDAALACHHQRVPFGIYHVTNEGSITTRRVTELIGESGVCEKEFRFFDSEQQFRRTVAKAPRSNCVLSCEKLAAQGIQMRSVEQAIRESLEHWQPENTHVGAGR